MFFSQFNAGFIQILVPSFTICCVIQIPTSISDSIIMFHASASKFTATSNSDIKHQTQMLHASTPGFKLQASISRLEASEEKIVMLYYFDQSFTSLSHPKKKFFYFIHLKSKEYFSAISGETFPKIVNNWSK